ncbi:MAG: restriction endonuclease [Phycisphaerae bacterium]|nr:restriction endonuclease [Phycisphaerae bacterium]
MSRIDEAKEILASLGLPPKQRNERSALTLLALAHVGPKGSWKNTQQPLLRIWDIMGFMRERYGKDYAANSRETIRRQTIHQFEQARIVDRNPDEPSRPTNSGKTVYALTDDMTPVLRLYGTPQFDGAVADFIKRFSSLQAAYRGSRARHRVPLKMTDGSTVYLSPGKHNKLQVAVIKELGPRFAPGAAVLYVGDTALKHVVCATQQLAKLGISITQHDKLPDILLYWKERNWVFLIEAVTTHGPVDPKRHREIERMLKNCPAERVYVTAFLDVKTFRKYAGDIAWETEVWIAEHPDHMIHFNGPKFLGPYKTQE